jgi:MFS family permease
MTGALVVASGYGVAAVAHSHLWEVLLCTMVVGSGIGLAYGAVPALIMAAVPVTQTAAANSLNNLCRALGTSTGSAINGLLLVASTTSVGGLTVPSETAIVTVLLVGAGAALIALLISTFIPRHAATGRSATTALPPRPDERAADTARLLPAHRLPAHRRRRIRFTSPGADRGTLQHHGARI